MRIMSTMFYMLLSVLGLSVISLGGLIAAQYVRGKVSLGDLHSIMRVIGGTHRIMLPAGDFEEYQAFIKDKDAARQELELNRGTPESRVPQAMRDREAQENLRTNVEVQNRLLEDQKKVIADLRGEVEAQKQQVQATLTALDDERTKNAIVARDDATAKLQKTLSEMDAGDVGMFLTEVIRDPSRGGPNEAARIMREHLKADFAAEVLGEMPPPERQRVMPLLENRFAGVPPDAVVKILTDNRMSAGEIMVYLQQMNPAQALGVYLRLPGTLQDQIGPQVLRGV